MTTERAPLGQVVEAVANTVMNPTLPVLAEDLLLAHQLATDLKTALAGKHSTVWDFVQWLVNVT